MEKRQLQKDGGAIGANNFQTVGDLTRLSREDVQKLYHDLLVHQEELKAQNEELIQARNSLSEARDRYANLFEFAPLGYVILSEKNMVTRANLTACSMLGVKRVELEGKRFSHFIDGSSQDEFYLCLRRLKETGARQQCQVLVKRPDQTPLWVDVIATANPEGTMLALMDITTQKTAEEDSRKAEQRYRELVRLAPVAINEIGFKPLRYTSVNDAMCDLLGYSRRELLAMDPFELLANGDKARFESRISAWLSGKLPPSGTEYTVKTRDGRTIEAELQVSFTRDSDGNPSGAVVVAHDVTERNAARRVIDRQALILYTINNIGIEFSHNRSLDQLASFCLKILLDMTESKMGFISLINETGNMKLIAVSGPGIAVENEGVADMHHSSTMQVHYDWVFRNGRTFVNNEAGGSLYAYPEIGALMIVPLLYLERPIGIITLGSNNKGYDDQDIEFCERISQPVGEMLELRKLEQALRESERDYRELTESAASIILKFDSTGKITFINQYGLDFFGYKKDDLIGSDIARLVPETETGGRTLSGLGSRILERPDHFVEFENENVLADGKRVWVSWRNRAIRDENGNVCGMLAVGQDITRRRNIESELGAHRTRLEELVDERTAQLTRLHEELKSREADLKRLIEGNTDAMLVVDGGGKVRFTNAAGKKLLGRDINNKAFGYSVSQNPTEIEIIKKGRTIIADMRSSDITWQKQPARLVSLRDISQLKRASNRIKDLSRRVLTSQERERQAIGHELHDEVGGLLTGLKLALFKAKKGLGEAAKTPEMEYVEDLVGQTMDTVSMLSHFMRPEVLNERGLMEALEWHFDEYTRHTDIEVEFSRKGISGRLPADIEIAVYRIAQESLTNAARYSGVGKVTVTLEVVGDILYLNVEDSGRGFDPGLISATSSGIAGMQDRAYLAGGELTVYSSPGAGTQISCEIPLK